MSAICFRHVGPPPENWVFGSDWRAIKLYNYLLCSLISWNPTIWWPTVLVLSVHKTGQPIKLCSSCALSSFGLPHCQVWQMAMVSVLGSLKYSHCTCSWRWPGVRRCCSNWQMGKRYWHKSIYVDKTPWIYRMSSKRSHYSTSSKIQGHAGPLHQACNKGVLCGLKTLHPFVV